MASARFQLWVRAPDPGETLPPRSRALSVAALRFVAERQEALWARGIAIEARGVGGRALRDPRLREALRGLRVEVLPAILAPSGRALTGLRQIGEALEAVLASGRGGPGAGGGAGAGAGRGRDERGGPPPGSDDEDEVRRAQMGEIVPARRKPRKGAGKGGRNEGGWDVEEDDDKPGREQDQMMEAFRRASKARRRRGYGDGPPGQKGGRGRSDRGGGEDGSSGSDPDDDGPGARPRADPGSDSDSGADPDPGGGGRGDNVARRYPTPPPEDDGGISGTLLALVDTVDEDGNGNDQGDAAMLAALRRRD